MKDLVSAICLDVIDMAPNPVHIIDSEFHLWRNTASKKIFPERMSSSYCYGIIYGKDNPCEECLVKETFNYAEGQRKIRKFEGKFFEIQTMPYFNDRGSVVAVIEYLWDITTEILRQKKIEEQILELKKTALLDYLTGAFNRKGLDKFLEQAISDFKRRDIDFCLLMADIDYLKKINDQYGHRAGDGAIVALVNAMNSIFRAEDIITRFGGDEFLVLFRGAGQAEAIKAAEKLRSEVDGLKLRTDKGEIFNMTVSIGIISYNGKSSKDELIGCVDRALYEAKRKGRNTISALEI